MMKIGYVNGSPKGKEGCSYYLLEELEKHLGSEQEAFIINTNKPKEYEELYKTCLTCDSLVISFPLYVDGMPSHLIRFMEGLLQFSKMSPKKDILVYAISNNGFYESIQNKLALQMVEIWCEKAGFTWGMGLGVGSGPMLQSIKNVPMGSGPKKSLGKALEHFASVIRNTDKRENVYINLNFPRFAYLQMVHLSWRYEAKKNGLKAKDLFLR